MEPEVKLKKMEASSTEEPSVSTVKASVNKQMAAIATNKGGLSHERLPSREKFLEGLKSEGRLKERPSLLRRKERGKFKEPQIDILTGRPYVATVIDKLISAVANLIKGLERLLLKTGNDNNPLVLNQKKKRLIKRKREKRCTLLTEQSATEEEEKEEGEN